MQQTSIVDQRIRDGLFNIGLCPFDQIGFDELLEMAWSDMHVRMRTHQSQDQVEQALESNLEELELDVHDDAEDEDDEDDSDDYDDDVDEDDDEYCEDELSEDQHEVRPRNPRSHSQRYSRRRSASDDKNKTSESASSGGETPPTAAVQRATAAAPSRQNKSKSNRSRSTTRPARRKGTKRSRSRSTEEDESAEIGLETVLVRSDDDVCHEVLLNESSKRKRNGRAIWVMARINPETGNVEYSLSFEENPAERTWYDCPGTALSGNGLGNGNSYSLWNVPAKLLKKNRR